jgi:hypothetical protein
MLEYYKPQNVSHNAEHSLIYSFQYEDAVAHVFTTMGGNVAGGMVMQTEFDCGLTVPADHVLTDKHVIFYDDEDEDLPYREVGYLKFYYPNGGTTKIALEDCSELLVGIRIVDFKDGK